MSTKDARALVSKYAELVALRETSLPIAVARPRMIALSARFPGSLRELDRAPLGALRERLRHLREVVLGGATAEPWVAATARFHEVVRDELEAAASGRTRVGGGPSRRARVKVARELGVAEDTLREWLHPGARAQSFEVEPELAAGVVAAGAELDSELDVEAVDDAGAFADLEAPPDVDE